MENNVDNKPKYTLENPPKQTRYVLQKDKEKKNPNKKYNRLPNSQSNYKTFEGHKLTLKEAKFIDLYIETGNQRQSVIDAGYKTSAPGQYATGLLVKDYIRKEIDHRLQKLEDAKIASAEEIMQYFTGVMRGEIKDQFGLDAPLGERTKAAQELAKRKIDIVQRVNGQKQAEVKISLVWDENSSVDDDEPIIDNEDED